MLIEDVNDLLGTALVSDEVDTIGGWFMTQHIDATVGSVLEAEGYIFKVHKIVGRHINYLEVVRRKE